MSANALFDTCSDKSTAMIHRQCETTNERLLALHGGDQKSQVFLKIDIDDAARIYEVLMAAYSVYLVRIGVYYSASCLVRRKAASVHNRPVNDVSL